MDTDIFGAIFEKPLFPGVCGTTHNRFQRYIPTVSDHFRVAIWNTGKICIAVHLYHESASLTLWIRKVYKLLYSLIIYCKFALLADFLYCNQSVTTILSTFFEPNFRESIFRDRIARWVQISLNPYFWPVKCRIYRSSLVQSCWKS